jgi:hypothetical protein
VSWRPCSLTPKVRAVGVSNFMVEHLTRLFERATVVRRGDRRTKPLQMATKIEPLTAFGRSLGEWTTVCAASQPKDADLQGFSKATTGIEPV